MEADNNIGKFIDKKLQGLKDTPDEELWGRITTSLDKKKKKRIPVWYYLAPLFLVLGCLVTLTVLTDKKTTTNPLIIQEDSDLMNSEKSAPNSQVVTTDNSVLIKSYDLTNNNNTSDNAIPKSILFHKKNQKSDEDHQNSQLTSKSNYYSSTRNNQSVTETKSNEFNNTVPFEQTNILKNGSKDSLNPIQIEGATLGKNSNSITHIIESEDEPLVETNSSEMEKLEGKEKTSEPVANTTSKKFEDWSVVISGVGSHYASLNGSAIGSDFDNQNTFNNNSLNYGIAFQTNYNNNISVSIGVNHIRLKQTTTDISFDNLLDRYDPITDVTLMPLQRLQYINLNSELLEFGSPNTPFFNLKQEVEYLQIPLSIRQRLFKGKLHFELIYGLSYMLVLNDSFTYEPMNSFSSASRRVIGKSNQLRDHSFTANAGFGINVPLNSRFSIQSDAIFNYQLFPYADTNLHRAIINIQLGVRYKL